MPGRFGLVLAALLLVGCDDDGSAFDGGLLDMGKAVSDDLAVPDMLACGGPFQVCCSTSAGCLGGGCCMGANCVPSGASTGGLVCLAGAMVACGAAGQPCCAANGCDNDGCCVGGICSAQGTSCGGDGSADGTCSTSPDGGSSCASIAGGGSCGGGGQACCPGSRAPSTISIADYCVASGLVCTDSGMCAPCGVEGQSCCDGNSCNDGGCCVGGKCVRAGDSCPGSFTGQMLGTCVGGGCQDGTCGKVGQGCCNNGQAPQANVICSAPNTICQPGGGYFNHCSPCGGAGEPCCNGNLRTATTPYYLSRFCNEPYVCGPQATCIHCGNSGEPCCAGDTCGGSGKCVAGTCA